MTQQSLIVPAPQKSRIPALLTLISLLQLGLFGLSLLTWGSIARLSSQQQTALMQTATGEVQRLTRIDAQTRSPEVIQAFTLLSLMELFNWQGPQANSLGVVKPDKGIEMELANGEQVKVPERVALSSFVVAPGLQEALLRRIAEVVPPDYFSGKVEVLLTVRAISLPEKTDVVGEYTLTVAGDRYIVRDGRLPGQRESFNKIIRVRETPLDVQPLGETPLQKQVYRVRQAGLLIVDITDVSLKDQS